jgi:DNA-directed RNA polymerase specialized sigma24 family protein
MSRGGGGRRSSAGVDRRRESSAGGDGRSAGGDGRRESGDADDIGSGGNGGGPEGVYESMQPSTASTHPPPGAHRPAPVPRSAACAGPVRDVAVRSSRAVGVPEAPGQPPPAEVVALHPVAGDDVRGPEDGFSAFYRDAWPGVARALSVALGDRDLAVEATDEAMARAYPRWRKLSCYDNPGAWVYRVGLNWALSYRRRLARRPPPEGRSDAELPPVVDPAVHAALMDLPVGQRSVVVCRLLLDWSVDDTALALGVRPGTVQSRLHRALRSLHAALDHLR